MEHTKVLYSPEQIEIPQSFGDIIKHFSKEVIRNRVSANELTVWAANYFAELCDRPLPYAEDENKEWVKKVETPEFDENDLRPVPTATTQLEKDFKKGIDFAEIAKKLTQKM